jgi:hypothetical protein
MKPTRPAVPTRRLTGIAAAAVIALGTFSAPLRSRPRHSRNS